jgi:hypothetical protein
MEILFWIVVSLILSKIILKSVRPDINRLVDNKAKEFWRDLKVYFK